ncbi:hypothetical protein DWV16_09080 [Anaerotruncus sp. AF02-27]|uniref:UvrD-helicase domain-containing protein n=1 Tax=Anaerotruncus TaxID=244127 RepID=UPI000E4E0D78|nr:MULTISPECIES: UvrD-helicase domain-containing protein [Anaerotruncus]RGX55365.1 hypothetical protein DWV16_09080 [Anaerotruncus sp. AF02-27]
MYIADLHIHSKYSRATSRECVPEYLDLWARRKGIDLIGTGDFTHPAWREELREKLEPAEDGLYRLKANFRLPDQLAGGEKSPRFVLSGEISSIYKKNGRVRKVHNVILLPSLESAQELAKKLEAIGNVHSDGRPILGLDSRDLLEITLECCPDAVFIPAHIWTPHFSLFGAFSGFDTIEECFEDLTPHIHAVETGLSSDPPMNWRLSALDRFTLVSNSDAHSPAKLGREANLLDTELSYPALAGAIAGNGGFAGTIEFFPEEGKYHCDGHRNCGICLSPSEAEELEGRCPVCGKKLTTGVWHRVQQLADRPEGFLPQGRKPFESLVPLPEVIGSSLGMSPAGVRVQARYLELLGKLGPEFYILREAPLDEIVREAGPLIAEGVRRMRAGEVERVPGFDGEYGKIQLLTAEEIDRISGQISLFGASPDEKPARKAPARRAAKSSPAPAGTREGLQTEERGPLAGLNDEQKAAVTAEEAAVAVVAGPGTGKTKTLVARIAYLVQERGVKPAEITAVTFTNKAAGEMRERLEKQIGKRAARAMRIGTFHAVCMRLLDDVVMLADESEALFVAEETVRECGLRISAKKLLQEVSRRKNGAPPDEAEEKLPQEAYLRYCEKLAAYGARDFDDLLLETLERFEPQNRKESALRGFTHLLVDEFQDINDLQYRLVQAWSRAGESLFVIGDPDQSIYGFRGSDARCFARLAQDLPHLRQIRLLRNYRSTPEVIGCALPLIAHNGGEARSLEAFRSSGAPVRALFAADEYSEAIFIAKEINRLVGGIDMLDAQERREAGCARGFSDIAVLYRTHRQAEVLEKCLRIEGIPYTVTGRDKLLTDPDVREAVQFFRALSDPGTAPLHRLAAKQQPEKFKALAEIFQPLMEREKPQKLLERWISERELSGSPAMEKLLGIAVCHDGMASFLQNLAFGGEGDLIRSGGKSYLSDAVSLLTLHGAKGLEFPVVFLCGVKKGVLPLDAPGRSVDLEEERRLFYVGMTRAQDELTLLMPGEPSPFFTEIPQGCLQKGKASPVKNPSGGKQLSLFE